MIGYYAHSHGLGHCNYASLFAEVFGMHLSVFTDRDYHFVPSVDVVRLDNENPDGTEFDRDRFAVPRALHYAPVHMRKITRRNQLILEAILARKLELLIIDVSVEMAMLARVSSVPYAYVRLPGIRNDTAHLNAFEGASFLLAYFPEELEDEGTPGWIRDKTVYLGFLSRFNTGNRNSPMPEEYEGSLKLRLLHLTGFGGNSAVDFGKLTDRYTIFSVGPFRLPQRKKGITQIGVVDSTRPYIEHADVVLAASGLNTTSEILSLRKRFIAQADPRPYGEQECTARNLHRLKWAVKAQNYDNLTQAVAALGTWRQEKLPNVSNRGLSRFFTDLKRVNFRVDHYLSERSRFDDPAVALISDNTQTTNILFHDRL